MIPNRKDRRRLDCERSLGSPPILPPLGEMRHTMILENGTELSGWDFQVSPISVGALDPIRLSKLYTDICKHIY